MATRNMRLEGDDILEKMSKPVEAFDKRLYQLLDDMAETLEQHNGAGLAAVQVGVLKRVFLVDVGDGIIEFINPEIIEEKDSQHGVEGCLSYPGKWGMVTRPNFVKVRAQDRKGKWFEVEGSELFARAVCHENDHLNGISYLTHVERFITPEEMDTMGD